MKAYSKKDKCWCTGPPYERCELCKPNTYLKKKMRRKFRKQLKRMLMNEETYKKEKS